MRNKRCSRCKKNYPITNFYFCKGNKDGKHLWCKYCLRKKQRSLYKRHYKEGFRRKQNINYKDKTLKYRIRYPEKYYAYKKSVNLRREKGRKNHHWSYLPEHATDIFRLSNDNHAKVHRYMTYDQERCMYRKLNGELIDTKEKARLFYLSLRSKD